MIKKYTAITALLMIGILMIGLFGTVECYTAFAPIVKASRNSNSSKVEDLDETEGIPDEVVDFTMDVGLDDQNSVVPDNTAYDDSGTTTDEDSPVSDGNVFVIVVNGTDEAQDEPDEAVTDTETTDDEETVVTDTTSYDEQLTLDAPATEAINE